MDSISDRVAGGHSFFHTLLHGTVYTPSNIANAANAGSELDPQFLFPGARSLSNTKYRGCLAANSKRAGLR